MTAFNLFYKGNFNRISENGDPAFYGLGLAHKDDGRREQHIQTIRNLIKQLNWSNYLSL